MIALTIPELRKVKVRWEDVPEGTLTETVYVVAETQNGFIGFLLDDNRDIGDTAHFKRYPHVFIYDEALYGEPAEEKHIKQIKNLDLHRQRMKAIETLLNTNKQTTINKYEQAKP